MKILITILLALFLSSHASAEFKPFNEVISKGKIIHKDGGNEAHTYTILYNKKIYFCFINMGTKWCSMPTEL